MRGPRGLVVILSALILLALAAPLPGSPAAPRPVDVLNVLRKRLASDDPAVRARAAYGLAILLPDEIPAMLLLRRHLADPSAEVRREALLGLLARRETWAITPESLLDLIRDPDPGVRCLARGGLAGRAWRRKPAVSSGTLSRLHAMRREGSVPRRADAVRLMGSLPVSVDTLLPEIGAALRDRTPTVRRTAAETLARLPEHPLTRPLLDRALDDPAPRAAFGALAYHVRCGTDPDRRRRRSRIRTGGCAERRRGSLGPPTSGSFASPHMGYQDGSG